VKQQKQINEPTRDHKRRNMRKEKEGVEELKRKVMKNG
jgi:hypothetical protein